MQDDDREYIIVMNDEEQYSLWFADREPPAGWRRVGPGGKKSQCLAYIKEHWTDMRPRSLRDWMDQQGS